MIVDLLDDHAVFERVLGQLRSDVHARRLAAAWARFEWLDGALRAHVELEERELLPRFEVLDHPVPNGAPGVFRRDHRLILRHLDAVREGWDDPVARAEGLGQLDGVLEHHDRREARYFKPRLDSELDPEAVVRILEGWERAIEPVVEPAEVEALPRGRGISWCVAMGDVEGALRELDALDALPGKGPRLAARVRERLERGALVEAWDALRLLVAVIG